MTKKDVVEKYIRRFPDTPHMTLARKIYNENNELFTKVDVVRSYIRQIKGPKRKGLMTPVEELMQDRSDKKNPFKIPESDLDDFSPYVINHNSFKSVAILNDIHFPYHDKQALETALEFLHKDKPDMILINGDLLDFHSLSRFVKDPRSRSLSGELQMGRDFFAMLQKQFPKTKVVYKIGNHEERLETYLYVKAPELLDMQEFKMDILLHLGGYGVDYIDNKRMIKYMGLDILHGHEFFGNPSQAVNPARGLFNKTYGSACVGHFHKTSEHTEKTLDGDIMTTWSMGCLCGLQPAYARFNRWNHGFAVVRNSGDRFTFHNYRIDKGRIY
jgi:predicted phosphodiesterase